MATTLRFAQLFELDGEQVLLEVLPSQNEDKRQAGVPDVMISLDLGWSFYEARVELRLSEKGEHDLTDPHAYLLSTFTQDKARDQLAKIKAEFGGQAIVNRMLSSGEYSLGDEDDLEEMKVLQDAQGAAFAKLIEVDGRQVLALRRHDLGQDEDTDGVLIKVAQPGGHLLETRVEGLSLDQFDEAQAKLYVEQAQAIETRKKHSLN